MYNRCIIYCCKWCYTLRLIDIFSNISIGTVLADKRYFRA